MARFLAALLRGGSNWTLTEQVRDRGVSTLLVTHSMDEDERSIGRIGFRFL